MFTNMKIIVITSILSLLTPINAFFFTSVPEGYVGIYYRMGGSLMETTSDPGFYLKYPWPVTSGSEIEIRPQTDTLDNVKCGASDGTQLYFETVDVGNHLIPSKVHSTVKRFGEGYDTYLIKDKVRHQINVICSSMTSQEIAIDKFDTLDDSLKAFLQEENEKENSGVVVDFVRLSKPVLPLDLQRNYDRIANEKTALKVAKEENLKIEQEQKNKILIVEKTAEAERVKAEKENEIALQKAINAEEVATIQNRILKDREEAKANAILFTKQKEAAGNSVLLTHNYVELERARALASNAKHYFGDVPNALFLKDTEDRFTPPESAYHTSQDL
ncbi:hypothetical protein CPAV1605_1487 [seawater metagenome]|uniref:Band 7 domain-containing protein n=1 Tax=seawater metagenome TaxID=1561972 RepID=A0A5E8CMC8_9ZZZZ